MLSPPLSLLLVLAAATGPAPDPGPSIELLFHADLEGNFAVPACRPGETEPPDLAALVTAARAARAEAAAREAPPPIALFGGNAVAPGLFARGVLKHEAERGAADLAAAFAEGGYDALALGHHDLSIDRDRLERFVAAATARGMPVVATNLRCDPARQAVCRHVRPHVMVARGDLRVGVLATLSPLLLPGIPRANLAGMALEDPEEAVRAATRRLRAGGARVVVLLAQAPRSDAGAAELARLARRLGPEGPDVVLAGGLARREEGSAVRLVRQDRAPALVGSTEGAESLAHVRLAPRDAGGEITVAVLPAAAERDPGTAALLDRYREGYCARYGAGVGPGLVRGTITREAWLRYVLSVMRREARAEIALVNRDFVKATAFPVRGVMTRAALYRAMPYHGVLGTARITGARLAAAVGPALANERLVALGLEGGGARPLTVNGRPLDPTRHYRVATIPFVAEGGDRLLGSDALPFRPLAGTPDVRDLVERFLETRTGEEDGDRSIDPETDFGPPASERALVVAVTDLTLDLTDTSIRRQAGYAAPQLTRAEQRALKGELGALLLLRSRLHDADGRLRMLYGHARNQPADRPAVSVETADLVSLSGLYSFRGLRDLSTPIPRRAVPDPYARLLLESEFTPPDPSPTQPRDFRHAELTTTAGAIFTVTPKLRARGGPGLRRQLLAPRPAGRTRLLVEAGATLDSVPLGTLGVLTPRLEAVVDYVYVDPAADREHQLKGSARLALPLLPHLFVTAGLDVFAMRREERPWAAAFDLTVGLRVRLDAAHQRL